VIQINIINYAPDLKKLTPESL